MLEGRESHGTAAPKQSQQLNLMISFYQQQIITTKRNVFD
jgi:hypothetical protein